MTDRIKQLEREVELLNQIVALQKALLSKTSTVTISNPNVYPTPSWPYNTTYNTIPSCGTVSTDEPKTIAK